MEEGKKKETKVYPDKQSRRESVLDDKWSCDFQYHICVP
jgi:hypothetical protein